MKAAQGALNFGGDLFDYAAKGNKVEYVGTEKVDGKDCYKLKVTTKDGRELTDYIDRTTNYLVKTEATTKVNGQDMTAITTFADHKKTDIGLVIPYTTTVNQGFEMTISVAKVEFNKEVDPKIFEMPK